MDNLSEKIRARFDHEAAKQVLREKYEAKLLFAHQGGMFRATSDLIVLLSSYGEDQMMVVDEYGTPVLVDRVSLLQEAKQRNQEQLNAWAVELADIRNQR